MKRFRQTLAVLLIMVMAFSFTSYAGTKISRSTMETGIKKCFKNWGTQGKGWDFSKQDGYYLISIYDYDLWEMFFMDAYTKGNDKTIHKLANDAAAQINAISTSTQNAIKAAGYTDGAAVAIGKDKDHLVYVALNGTKFYDARYDK